MDTTATQPLPPANDVRVPETQRLLLRPFTLGDVEEIHRLVYADAAVADWWSGLSREIEDVRERIASTPRWQIRQGFGFHAVVRKEDRVLLGLMGFQRHTPDEDNRYLFIPDDPDHHVGHDPDLIEAELTYAFGQRYWRRGYATEAGLALLAEGFGATRLDRIVNGVASENSASIHLMKRLGFTVSPNNGDGVIGILDRAAYAANCVSPPVPPAVVRRQE